VAKISLGLLTHWVAVLSIQIQEKKWEKVVETERTGEDGQDLSDIGTINRRWIEERMNRSKCERPFYHQSRIYKSKSPTPPICDRVEKPILTVDGKRDREGGGER
jgi:hypothetical protein